VALLSPCVALVLRPVGRSAACVSVRRMSSYLWICDGENGDKSLSMRVCLCGLQQVDVMMIAFIALTQSVRGKEP